MTNIYQVLSSYALSTHWGRVTHICVGKLTLIGSDNGLSPGRRQAIIRTNAGILLIGLLGTNFSEILIEIHTFSFKKMRFKLSSGKWRPFCPGLNVLRAQMRMHCSYHMVETHTCFIIQEILQVRSDNLIQFAHICCCLGDFWFRFASFV